eukprot:3940388-Rhodomonas_salina.5
MTGGAGGASGLMWPASAGGGPDTHRLPSRVNVFELDISHSEIKCKEKLSRATISVPNSRLMNVSIEASKRQNHNTITTTFGKLVEELTHKPTSPTNAASSPS